MLKKNITLFIMGYLIELKTTQASAIKTIVETLNSILSDVNLTFLPFNKDDVEYESSEESDSDSDSSDSEEEVEKSATNNIGGVIIKEVNKTSSILIHCKLDADKFEYYKYNYPKKRLTIGVNLANLLKCLKCMTHFDTMTWAIDEDDINKLILILESAERNEKKTFKLNLMDLDNENYEVDSVEFPYSINLPSSDFHKYCKDMASVAEKMEIKCTSNRVFFSGKGELGIVDFEVGESLGGLSIDIMTKDHNEIVQGLFELKYLIIFTKCTSLCNSVYLYLKNDYPIIIKYSVAALGDIKLVLSPSKS